MTGRITVVVVVDPCSSSAKGTTILSFQRDFSAERLECYRCFASLRTFRDHFDHSGSDDYPISASRCDKVKVCSIINAKANGERDRSEGADTSDEVRKSRRHGGSGARTCDAHLVDLYELNRGGNWMECTLDTT